MISLKRETFSFPFLNLREDVEENKNREVDNGEDDEEEEEKIANSSKLQRK